ncbi:hypothetical protein CUMW_089870 [Citrus unshiu]|nr:hypothetical protein CUMW_089870 [Citrus unshiu]
MHMATRNWVALFVVLSCLLGVLDASAGDADPLYRACVKQCEETGCVGQKCFPHCKFSSDGASIDGPWYMQEPLYLQWKKWDCLSDCRYNCMVDREIKRDALGHGPVKYHGKWPFIRVYGIQEPASVAFSVLNLAMHFHGWLSFFILLYYKLPLKQTKKAYYEFSPLWHIYGFLSMNSWFWSAVFHRWNMKVCVVMAVAQLLIWATWAGITRHPSRWKLWVVVFGGALAMLLEIYDFPPYYGFLDAHAIWHATTIPLTYIWWSFIRDDAEFQTANMLKKAKVGHKSQCHGNGSVMLPIWAIYVCRLTSLLLKVAGVMVLGGELALLEAGDSGPLPTVDV